MNNYFRLTVYHPEKDICAILDSNGLYEKVWQFSSFLIGKNFKILEHSTELSLYCVLSFQPRKSMI